jgi:transcriptional regulator with XRE-family HTH domain
MAYTHKTRTEIESDYLQRMGLKIKHHRLLNDMTQLDLAMAIDVFDPATIARYEAGNISIPVYRLHNIAKALNVDITWLIVEL